MEYLNETIFLGVDLIILGLCVKEYVGYKKTLSALKTAEQLQIDGNLKTYVKSKPNQKIPYAIIRGNVVPIGNPIRSAFSPTVTGVIQVMKLSEHRVARGFAGFWTEQRKLIHVSSNEVPFTINNEKIGVEILDGISAEILDLDVVYDNYEPSKLSFFDHVFGFFSGIRQRGVQTTEEMLRDGSFITAIGELELDGDSLKLQPSNNGPMFLTTATKNILIKKFQEAKSSSIVKIVFCGTISVVLLTVIGRRIYLKKKQQRSEKLLKDTLEAARKQRRSNDKQKNLPDDLKCVICFENPKQVIILPCGHVCLCEECSNKILLSCPMCRKDIVSKAAAFI